MLNTVLALVVAVYGLVWVLAGAFAPAVVLPSMGFSMMAALSVLALAVESYLAPRGKRNWAVVAVLAVLTFGLLSWAAGMAGRENVIVTAVLGGATCTVLALVFQALRERMSSGPACKAAPVVTAGMLFLACQCLVGIL